MPADPFSVPRKAMVDEQLRARDIVDDRVLAAMDRVPRHFFVPEGVRDEAYEDHPLPIGAEQTISQPYIVALMLQEAQLTSSDRFLEIGTGSGYAAAVAAECVERVFTIERIPELVEKASSVLQELGYEGRIDVRLADGSLGLSSEAPFDVIVVTCGAPEIPPALLDQLADGGRLVIPVGDRTSQRLVRITREDSSFREEWLHPVRFVPLIGEQGY